MRPFAGLAVLLGLKTSGQDALDAFTGLSGPAGVTGVTHDSRLVRPGDLYVALPGSRFHGARFCPEAAAAGAAAVLTDPSGRDGAVAAGLPAFVVADPRARLGEVAAWIYGYPAERLLLIGVTGTSGKTTTTYLLESGLRAAGYRTGLIGGVQTRIVGAAVASQLTTPEATDLQALLAVMVERRVGAAAMEVSSHALALGRVAGTRYDVAVFTNLSQDHLDFHDGIEDYFAAKAQLFTAALRRGRGGEHRRPARPRSWPRAPRSRSPRSPPRAAARRTGGPRTSGPAPTAAPSGSSGPAAWRPTRPRPCPARSTWPTRSAPSSAWSRPGSGWPRRWPGWPPARACRAGWSGWRPARTSPCWSTTRTSRGRSRRCWARCARSPSGT